MVPLSIEAKDEDAEQDNNKKPVIKSLLREEYRRESPDAGILARVMKPDVGKMAMRQKSLLAGGKDVLEPRENGAPLFK
ncbi:MAG: hypothetical protein ALECFALPRED_001630 [Alectoria fallacina]|uniref:Uncharacterized protein n=1 Tax=Alectoria fallacina TaxID=1903189 RepID=A0A8H3PL20_9LECA|nr:MAG: hypothetical protein ALECFALPRED_001630 [Alectoria fallacina]